VFEKWDLHAVRVGTVSASDRLRIFEGGVLVADVPTRALTDEAPVYRRPMREPAWQRRVQQLDLARLTGPRSAELAFDTLIASPIIASKRWAYRQYDHTVGTNTVAQPGMSAAVVRVKGTRRGLALSVDCNSRFCHLDPYRGAMLAVAESARNIACAGAEPIGATNNLNFGNPERPEIMWQLAEAVRGIGDACRAFGIPITGGNVSLYNETDGEAIYPTPVLGVLGLLQDHSQTTTRQFKRSGARVVLVGDNRGELGGSEYLAQVHGVVGGQPPSLDLSRERQLQQLLVSVIREGLVDSAHDCAEGGLAIALAECCFDSGGIGVTADLAAVTGVPDTLRIDATLFGESASRAVISTDDARLERLLAECEKAGVPAQEIGRTGGERIRLSVDGGAHIDVAVADAEEAWAAAIEKRMGR
jgi:phosphoribosylformylglycinamidine synthase